MSVRKNFQPTYTEKILAAMKAQRAVKRITFDRTEAGPGDTLYVTVPKLNENEVLVPGSLSLLFEIDLSGGNVNNFLVQNVTRALIDRFIVKFAGQILQDTVGYDIYKTFEDLFLSQETREGMILEGIQSEDLCKIRSGAGDKKTSGVEAENKLEEVFGKKYRIRLDHQILTDHGVFYPKALYNDLTFDITLASAWQVVRGPEKTQLKYKLKNIVLEYEMMHSKTLADVGEGIYSSGKELTYDHVLRSKVVKLKNDTDTLVNIKVNTQRRSLKAILLLFVEPYDRGLRDSEKYIFPDITKVSVTINGSPNMIYNNGIEGKDMWEEASRFFVKEKNKTENMNLTKFYTGDKFGLLIDMRSMADQTLHGSGTRLVNSTDGVQLEIERKAAGSGKVNCHVFVIADSQFNIMDRKLQSVQY